MLITLFAAPKHSAQYLALIVVVAVSLFSIPGFANNSYSAGLNAYLNNDFELAQSQWLRGAKAGDAKSMFNLGLLHQQEKISNADNEAAEKWFRLAGKYGSSHKGGIA